MSLVEIDSMMYIHVQSVNFMYTSSLIYIQLVISFILVYPKITTKVQDCYYLDKSVLSLVHE